MKLNTKPKLEWLGLTLVLLIAAFARVVALDTVPPGPGYDELQDARLAERILAGQGAIYFTDNSGQEPLYPTLEAVAVRALGWSLFTLRLPAAFLGVLATAALYLAAQQLVNRRAAFLAAAFYAVSLWPVGITRMALEDSLLPPMAALSMACLAHGWREHPNSSRRSLVYPALSGLFLGGQVYAYTAGRAAQLFPPLLLLYLLILNRAVLRRRWQGWLVLCLVTLLVAAPLAIFLRAHPEAEQRLDQLVGPLTALRQGDLRPIAQLTLETLGMFTFRAEPQWLYNVSGRPVFDPVTSLFFYIGLTFCISRWREWRSGVILLWLLVGLAPAFISPPPGSFTHTLVAQPVVYLLLGAGLDAACQWMDRWRTWVGQAAILCLLALNGLLSSPAYFVSWANAAPVRELYQGSLTEIARQLDASDPPGAVAIGAPYINYWHPWNALGFDLQLRRNDLDVRWFNPAGAWVWPVSTGNVTYYVPDAPLGAQTFDPALEQLFLADATPLLPPGRGTAAYSVTSPTALDKRLSFSTGATVAWPPEWAHLAPAQAPINFGDRLALLAVELGETTVEKDNPIRLITYWQVLAAESSPLVAFVHLTSGGQDVWGQADWLDVRAESLRPGDRFAQVHLVPVKPETPAGRYHLQLGLYHPGTLARLPVQAHTSATIDRIWLSQIIVVK